MPLFSTVSFLDPVRNQNPKDTDLTYGIVSVTTLIPFGKIVLWYKQPTSLTTLHGIFFIIDSIPPDVNEIPKMPGRRARVSFTVSRKIKTDTGKGGSLWGII